MKNEQGIFVPQFPYNYKDESILKPLTQTPDKKYSSPSKSQPIQTIPQTLFEKLNVSIVVSNPETIKVVERAMISVGAHVVDGPPEFADIIISESQISQLLQKPHINSMSRGKRMVDASRKININRSNSNKPKSQRFILLKQIPWIFNSSEPTTEPKPLLKTEKSDHDTLVVSDIRHQHKPMVMLFRRECQIYLGEVPQGYPLTPFDPIPITTKNIVERYKAKLGTAPVVVHPQPANDGFCYICQLSFDDAATHHCSFTHKIKAEREDWSEFDELEEIINSEFFNYQVLPDE